MTETLERIEGVVIGVLMGFDADAPLVVFAGNPREAAVPARSLAALDYAAIGAEVALLFEDGDPLAPADRRPHRRARPPRPGAGGRCATASGCG